MFLDVCPKLQTKPSAEIWAWSFCKVRRCDKRNLSWWYKIINMLLSRYPTQLFLEECHIKTCSGQQSKVWKRLVDDIFEYLEFDKGE